MLSERMLLPIFRKCLLPFKISQIWIYLSFNPFQVSYLLILKNPNEVLYQCKKKNLFNFPFLHVWINFWWDIKNFFSAFSLLSIAKLQNKDLWLNCNAWRTVLMLPFSNHYHIMIVRQNFCSMKCIGLSN